MDLLLDTHALIWFLNGDEKLSKNSKLAIEDPNNNKLVRRRFNLGDSYKNKRRKI